ncbi:hypothetical protein BDY24DRAFT_377992 [Mrakia frigida]|uniref:uncharacterized protein n=1 Tax=Mrakia frigida TaxID=29902 RepID=UPI003FCBFFDC
MLSSGSTSPNSLLLSSTSNSSASTSSSAHSSAKSGGGGGTIEQEKKWKLEEEREQLDGLLESAFGYESVEKAAWVELADQILSDEKVTAQQIGLASSFASYRRFASDEHNLLGGGWQTWMVQPRKGDGGKEVVECCVRYSQDTIHTLFSRARYGIKEGDYSLAKETARRSLLAALVKAGYLPSDHLRRGSSNAHVLSAAEEGSILELPHLSPSLQPTELSLSPTILPSLSSPADLSLLPPPSSFALQADPPLTPADSPQLSPKQFGLGLLGRGVPSGLQKLDLQLDLEGRVFQEEEEGMRTPVARQEPLAFRV